MKIPKQTTLEKKREHKNKVNETINNICDKYDKTLKQLAQSENKSEIEAK